MPLTAPGRSRSAAWQRKLDLRSDRFHIVSMSTKADLLTAWCKWTGDRVPEARHRIRALSEADLLPSRAHPLSYEDLARALLGFVATAQHKDAPEAVRKVSAARCGAASADNQEVPLMGMSLLEAVTAALQPPFRIAGLNTTTGFCHLEVVNGWLTLDWDDKYGTSCHSPPLAALGRLRGKGNLI